MFTKLITTAVFCSLLFTQTFAVKTFTLEEMVADSDFTVTITATGTHGGRSVELNILSNYRRAVEVFIPAGTVFRTGDPRHQPLLIVEDELIAIAKKGRRKKLLDGYCIAASRVVPREEMELSFGPTDNPQLQQLADYLKDQRGLEEHAIQEAVWCVSNHHPLSYIYAEDQQKGMELIQFVADLTAREVPWHRVRRHLRQSGGYIEAEPVLVSATARFTPEHPTRVRSKVVDANGNIVFENADPFTIPAAKEAGIKFNLSVSGWEPGTYSVIFYDQDGNDLLKKEFVI